VEKPATSTFEELDRLLRRAQEAGRYLIEDHNYVFNHAPREILKRIESGEFGAVTHVEVLICLDILAPGGHADKQHVIARFDVLDDIGVILGAKIAVTKAGDFEPRV
jgi:predicted dehydrogenase